MPEFNPSLSQKPRPDLPLFAALCLFLLAIYVTTAVPYPRGLDELNIFSVGRSLAARLSFDDDALSWTSAASANDVTVNGPDGHAYTPKDVTPSLIAAPFIQLAYLTSVSPIHAAHLSNILASLLIAALVFIVARGWGYGQPTAALAMLTFGLGSQAWPYATSLMTQTCAGFGLMLAVWGLSRARSGGTSRHALIAGLGMGFAGLSVTVVWAVAPLFVLYFVPWEDIRRDGWRAPIRAMLPLVTAFIAGCSVGLLAGGIYNAARFGSPFDIGQGRRAENLDFQLSYFPVGGFGLLFGAPTGLLWFVPFVLLVPFGAVMSFRAGHARRTLLLIAPVALMIGLYGSYFMWWASTLWGPRYLVLVMPLLALLTLPLLDQLVQGFSPLWSRLFVGAVLALSVITQLAVTLLDFSFISQKTQSSLLTFTPPTTLAAEAPFLTNPRLIPQVQAVLLARQGAWAPLWARGGNVDWAVLAGGIMLIMLAGATLWIAARRAGSRLVRPTLIAQAALSLVFAGALLARYPHAGVPFHPAPPDLPGIDQAVEYIKREALPGDAVVTLLYPTDSYAWLDHFDSSIPDIGLTLQSELDANARVKLDHLPGWHDRVWLVSNATSAANPDNAVERALAQTGYIGQEMTFEGWRVVLYGLDRHNIRLGTTHETLGDEGISLIGYSTLPSEHWISVRLRWETTATPRVSYSVFVHLLDAAGNVVAQHDGAPVAGFAPTNTWTSQSVIDDRHALLLPADLPPGEYRVMVGMYDPATGERLKVSSGGDVITLRTWYLPENAMPAR